MATGNSICVLLTHNPGVNDNDLAGVIRANLVDFSGNVKVQTTNHTFAAGRKQARVIYITPYGKIGNFLIGIKRSLAGAEFPALAHNGSHITSYVLGLLVLNSAEYNQAKQEADLAWEQGRRFIIAISANCSDISVVLEQNIDGKCSIS